jgi:adenylosuccinate synthase
MTNYIVTGLGFGDEGKGTITDYFARQGESALVVRHNGGPQAGHNVVTSTGAHHTFSSFGSGTFAGAKTFLSYSMLINPLNMMREAASLMSPDKGQFNLWGRTYIDQDCIIITPWHAAINRLQERARGDSKHGSVGEGVGVATEQALALQNSVVRAKDTMGTAAALRERLIDCRVELSAKYLSLIDDSPEGQILSDPDMISYLVNRYMEWKRKAKLVPSDHLSYQMGQHEHTIFEGAQGVLLDEWYGFHPYTTWSTTTHENAMALLIQYGPQGWAQDFQRIGVIRSYTTRHGAGPLPTYDEKLTRTFNDFEAHNNDHPWQGSFRAGHLDLVAHKYAIRVCDGIDSIAVTHLDYENRWQYCPKYKGLEMGIQVPDKGDLEASAINTGLLETVAKPVLIGTDTPGLIRAIEANLGPVSLLSYGPAAVDKRAVVPA